MNQVMINVNKTGFERHCLLKYIVQPFDESGAGQWHQNLWQVPMLAALIGGFGYNVDAVNWNAEEVVLPRQYDLLLDISPHNRQAYCQYLKPGCPQILYATGSCPSWQRRREEERLEAIRRRRGIRLEPRTSLAYQYPHPDEFQALFLVGNRRTLDTFGPVTSAQVSFIKNSGYVLPPPIDVSQKSPRDFLFFASQPQVLKGLDLLLEAFAASPEVNLYVCSLFSQEPDFCKAYEAELFHRPNIKPVGFVDIRGELFREIVRRCPYVILPSCSEGISGSVLAAMSAGLIPIVSPACGLEQDEAQILEDCSVEGIRDAIRHFAGASDQWLCRQAFRSLAIVQQRYNPRHYILSVAKALAGLLGSPPEPGIPSVSHLVQKRSACMIANTRVGIPLTGGKQWHGGVSYVETLVRSLSALARSERPALYLVISEGSLADFDCYRPFVHLFDGLILLGSTVSDLEAVLGTKPIHCQSLDELFSLVDFYYPVNSDVLPYRQAVSWIPDFQHRYLPDFFSGYEYQARESQFLKIAQQAKLLILNSRSAESDFRKFYPESGVVTRILSASPQPEENWYTGNPEEVQAKYRLPERFVLCSNQFWVHKNHLTLFQAVSLLKKTGRAVHLVCTGPTDDYRIPGYFEILQGQIDALGIRENVSILGLIPREDQIQLLRRSLFVVQPSLFEGLSLVVQECRALAKPIVLSDLDVHVEYSYGTTFRRSDPQDLAVKMDALLSSCRPGPDKPAESLARTGALAAVEARAREFCEIVLEYLGCSGLPAPRPEPAPPVTILTSLTPDNILVQQAALRSWRQCGFTAVALNSPADIDALRPHFPDTEFVPAYRDGRSAYGRPCVYIQDLLDCASRRPTAVCGIVKADIVFKGEKLAAFMAKEAADSIVFGSRLDVEALESVEGTPRTGGFDYVFFPKNKTGCYPAESFCLGLYWWDYWLILMAIANDLPGKMLVSPVAWHVRHAAPADVGLWTRLGILLSRYAETDYAVTPEKMAEYQQLLFYTIRDNSVPLHING
ncbi:MAG: glycosyltransferase [Negativicutes bacterium]|nr:glycosyltransferase [Negativicutes bacterium]